MKTKSLWLLGLVMLSGAAFADPCDFFHDIHSCNQQPSCKWIGALNQCESRAVDCREMGNKWACDQDPNCYWDFRTGVCFNRGVN